MASCRGYLDGMKKMSSQLLLNYSSESTKTFRAESGWYCVTADTKHLVVKATQSDWFRQPSRALSAVMLLFFKPF